jgi:hypothetical protein
MTARCLTGLDSFRHGRHWEQAAERNGTQADTDILMTGLFGLSPVLLAGAAHAFQEAIR